MESSNSAYKHTPNKMHTYVHQKMCSRMFITTLLVIASNQKPPKNLSTIEWINMFLCMHIAVRMNLYYMQHMDESQKHVEPKKPDVKEYAFLYIKYKTGKTNLC